MCAASGKSSKSRRAARTRPPTALDANSGRAFAVTIVLLALACIAVHVASSSPVRAWMWGAHFYAFFPGAVLLVATILLAVSLLILLPAGKRTVLKLTGSLASALSGWRGALAASLAVMAGTALFWWFRICHTYLGDGNTIVAQIDNIQHLLPREPLTSLLQYAVYGVAKPWFLSAGRPIEEVAREAVAVGSVTAGFVFLSASWFLSDEMARLRPADDSANDRRPLVALIWLCLVSQGFVQLFFGYVENYSFHAAAVVVFLWLCLRCLRGACPLILPALALLLCVALHLSSMVLAVPFLAVAGTALAARERRRRAIRDLAIVGALVVTAEIVLARSGYDPLKTITGMMATAFAERRNAGYMFTGPHYRDFFNEQILIGPLGLFLFVAGALVTFMAAERPRGRAVGFCILAGGACLLACWMFGDSNLGYARDWDLLSHSGIVFTAAGLSLFLTRRARASTVVACLGIAAVMSAYHTIPWIVTNAHARTSLARLETMPLGLGRTEVLVAEWYRRAGDDERQRMWLERSIAAYPGSVTAHYLLGRLELKQKHYDLALASLRRTVALRPDKVGYHFMLARAYSFAGQPAEAIPHLKLVVSREPDNMMVAMYLAEALYQTGETADAQNLFTQIERVCREIGAQHPNDSLVLATRGWALFRTGKVEDARVLLARAVSTEAPLRESECYLGYVLHSLGMDEDARSHFRHCLADDADLPPEIPDHDGVTAWLSASAGAGP